MTGWAESRPTCRPARSLRPKVGNIILQTENDWNRDPKHVSRKNNNKRNRIGIRRRFQTAKIQETSRQICSKINHKKAFLRPRRLPNASKMSLGHILGSFLSQHGPNLGPNKVAPGRPRGSRYRSRSRHWRRPRRTQGVSRAWRRPGMAQPPPGPRFWKILISFFTDFPGEFSGEV